MAGTVLACIILLKMVTPIYNSSLFGIVLHEIVLSSLRVIVESDVGDHFLKAISVHYIFVGYVFCQLIYF